MAKEIHVSQLFKMTESSRMAISSLFPRQEWTFRINFYAIVEKCGWNLHFMMTGQQECEIMIDPPA